MFFYKVLGILEPKVTLAIILINDVNQGNIDPLGELFSKPMYCIPTPHILVICPCNTHTEAESISGDEIPDINAF